MTSSSSSTTNTPNTTTSTTMITNNNNNNMKSSMISFMDALRSRYGAPDDLSNYNSEAFLVGDVGRRRNKKWELVGMEETRIKQANHSKLIQIGLRNCGINIAESEKDEILKATLHRLQEVDLSENPQLNLKELGIIVQHLPALTILQVSESPDLLSSCNTQEINNIKVPSPLIISSGLRKLVLHNVGLTSIWQLRALVDVPLLEELHLDKNNIQRLVLFDNLKEEEEEKIANIMNNKEVIENSNNNNNNSLWFPNVTTLSLAENKLNSWGIESGLNEVLTTAFPNVKRLFLTGNNMPNLKLKYSSVKDKEVDSFNEYSYLYPLELLCLNNNITITDASTLDSIRELCPHLHTFRITYNALFPQWNESLGRMYVVASLPTITTLNRGQVRSKERLDSEIFYVQRGLAAQQEEEKEPNENNNNNKDKIIKLHYPLLNVLKEKHKDIILAIHREGETASHDGITHMMLNLTFRCDGFEEVKKTVPSSLTVGKLKALLRAVFSVTPTNQELSFFTGDTGVIGRPTELDNELQSLAFYGVCNGAVIKVIDTSLRR